MHGKSGRPRNSAHLRWLAAVIALLSGGWLGHASAAPFPAKPGDPLPRLSAAERSRYELGRRAFERVREIETGLGPLFNDSSCTRCHNKKGVGGAGIQVAVLAGRLDGGVFDPLLETGGPLIASNTVMLEPATHVQRWIPNCSLSRTSEATPPGANVFTRRRTTPLFGLGLVDATPDATFIELARRQPEAIRGRAAFVPNPATGAHSVGKFGWKAQSPSLHHFAGMALSSELGITNPQFPLEQAPHGNIALIAACDAVPGLEDDGSEVQSMTDFMALLAPIDPSPPNADARAGDALFSRVGCDGCHVRKLESGPSPIAALSEKAYAPFSDFLLHDMGSLGDGIAEGEAAPREMRTAPLWSLRLSGSGRLLHDGRAHSFPEAIAGHDGQAARARDAFAALSSTDQRRLVAFLDTL